MSEVETALLNDGSSLDTFKGDFAFSDVEEETFVGAIGDEEEYQSCADEGGLGYQFRVRNM